MGQQKFQIHVLPREFSGGHQRRILPAFCLLQIGFLRRHHAFAAADSLYELIALTRHLMHHFRNLCAEIAPPFACNGINRANTAFQMLRTLFFQIAEILKIRIFQQFVVTQFLSVPVRLIHLLRQLGKTRRICVVGRIYNIPDQLQFLLRFFASASDCFSVASARHQFVHTVMQPLQFDLFPCFAPDQPHVIQQFVEHRFPFAFRIRFCRQIAVRCKPGNLFHEFPAIFLRHILSCKFSRFFL